MTSSDGITQIKQNIKQHRQKLLQLMESTNDTSLKPKIELVSKCVEKSLLKPKIELIDPEPSEKVFKKLSAQLLEEIQSYDSSDDREEASFGDSGDDDISVGTDDCTETFKIHNNSDVDENDNDEQLVNDKINNTYLDHNYSSGIAVLDVNNSAIRRIRLNRQCLENSGQPLPKSPTELDRIKQIRCQAEKKSRDSMTKLYDNLKRSCSDYDTGRKQSTKISILLRAKIECEMLKCTENRLLRKKMNCEEQRKVLKNRLAEIIHESKL